MDPFFTPLQALELQVGYYGVLKAERRSLEILSSGLIQKDAYVRQLWRHETASNGRKSPVHTLPVLILDEPTAGVDVELRRCSGPMSVSCMHAALPSF